VLIVVVRVVLVVLVVVPIVVLVGVAGVVAWVVAPGAQTTASAVVCALDVLGGGGGVFDASRRVVGVMMIDLCKKNVSRM
jgi:uncharacterized membrane protein